MINYFKSEWKKYNKWQAILISFVFLAISSFIGLGLYFSNQDALTEGTQSLVMWGQLTFYYSQLIYAPMLAILVYLSFLPEFERNTLNMLRANNVSMQKIITGKTFNIVLILIPSQITLFIIYLLGLYKADIEINISILTQFKWLLVSIIGSIPVICLQSYISAKIRNFSKSVGIAAIGAMIGFVLLFINQNLSYMYVYSFPMIALRSRALEDFTTNEFLFFLISCFLYLIIFYRLTKKELMKKQ